MSEWRIFSPFTMISPAELVDRGKDWQPVFPDPSNGFGELSFALSGNEMESGFEPEYQSRNST